MQVYVVSAYPAVRAGLAAVIREQPGWNVVGEAALAAVLRERGTSGVAGASGAASQPAPAVRTVDVVLADLDGEDDAASLGPLLRAVQPERGAVLLYQGNTTPGRGGADANLSATARTLADLLREGDEAGVALSILRRDAPVAEIVAALGAVEHGLVTLDRALAAALVHTRERDRDRVAAPVVPAVPSLPAAEGTIVAGEPLTAREVEVLQLMAQGLPNKTIALRLHISEHTAKFHVSSILMKLGAASRTEAVTIAARQGLLLL